MSSWGVIPSIRVRDMAEALAFYLGPLEFTLKGGGEGEGNSSVSRGDGHLMLETASDFYGDAYNAAIRERLGSKSSTSLYIESSDLAAFQDRLRTQAFGSSTPSPIGPGARPSSRSRITRATG